MPWNDGLEGQTLEIARDPSSPLRVIAGPGTGKTFALLRRLARLIEEHASPRRILLVTFTRVSAADLERELRGLGHPEGADVSKGTLHSLCFGLLSRRHVLQFTGRTPRPLLAFEERILLEDLGEYGEFGTLHDKRRMLKAFEAAWARDQDQDPGWPTTKLEQAFQATLEEWLRFHEAMLVDEIVTLTLRYLRSNPAAAELSQFDHVLVDEYQDLNRAEQSLIDLLATRASLSLVGDQDQAIYERFRYAHPEGIAEFHIGHPGTRDIPLDLSRRCPPTIVSLANSLIRNNMRRSGRQLIPSDQGQPVSVHVIQWPDMHSETEGIASFIEARVRAGEYDPGQTLVLCPRRQFGYLLRDRLRTIGIAAHSFFHEEALEGNAKLLPESLAQQAFTLLTLLAHPGDRVALRAWLGFGSPSLRSGEYYRLRNYCSHNPTTPWEALEAIRAGTTSIPHTAGIADRFGELVNRLRTLVPMDPANAFDELFPPDQPWAEPFRSIYEQAGGPLPHEDAHELLRVNITQPELPNSADFVRIMSLHKSKGLTAHHVYVTGCVEGLIPSHVDNLPFEEERRFHEEQRRLFYVAITRPRRNLVLSSVLTLPRDLAHRMRAVVRGGASQYAETIASSFLAELGPHCPSAITGDEWLGLLD
jgi:superfamily I DNA/RNA helicase